MKLPRDAPYLRCNAEVPDDLPDYACIICALDLEQAIHTMESPNVPNSI